LLLKLLCPKMFVERVEQIDLSELKDRGFNALILDLDNTLIGWRSRNFSPEVSAWIEQANRLGFKMCILSNSLVKWRVKRLGRNLGIPAINRAVKPRKIAFMQALRLMGAQQVKSVVVGDQVFTDIFGGNRLGLYTVLVRPIDKREFWTTILQRSAEKFLLFKLKRKGILKEVPGYKGKKYLACWEGKN
jgi:uncharacterized protein